MPYITQDDRRVLTQLADDVAEHLKHPGKLNYFFSRVMHQLIKHNRLSYMVVNALIGVLECCKLELYRTVVAPYENQKRRENGSVSDLDNDSHERMR